MEVDSYTHHHSANEEQAAVRAQADINPPPGASMHPFLSLKHWYPMGWNNKK